MAIITAAQVKEYLGVTTSGDDTLIGNLIDRAQAMAERHTNRATFEQGVIVDEAHDGDGTPTILLRGFPDAAGATVVKVLDDNGTSTTQSSDDYRLNAATGEIRLLGSRVSRWDGSSWDAAGRSGGFRYAAPAWPVGFQNILVSYVSGWDSGDEPNDLIQALIEITSILYNESKRRGDNMNSETLGDYSYTLNSRDERSKRIRELLAPFVRYTL